MSRYASATGVPMERSRAEIELMAAMHGASPFYSASDHEKGKFQIGWTMDGRMVRLDVPMPRMDAPEFKFRWWGGEPTTDELPAEKQRQRWEQACRARWRAVVLIVKAKFEAIEAGISTFEREFLADVVMSNGKTIGTWLVPQLKSMYETRKMPALLTGMKGSDSE